MRKPVAIVIPIWKEEITELEKISFKQCCTVLRKYTFFLITYKELNLEKYIALLNNKFVSFRVLFFDKDSFRSKAAYNRLILSIKFYSRFIRYKYILLYQLDCFVFRDELELWVEKGYSYIGAPWLKGYNKSKYGDPVIGVGNGGLSLRNIGAHLRVLLSFSYIKKPKILISNRGSFLPYKLFIRLFAWIKSLTVQNNTFFMFNDFTKNEDIFWSKIAPNNFSWFKIPDWKVAALFSIEVQPEYLFELNGQRIPFGCHAWWAYDLDFWKPYIEKYGYSLAFVKNNK